MFHLAIIALLSCALEGVQNTVMYRVIHKLIYNPMEPDAQLAFDALVVSSSVLVLLLLAAAIEQLYSMCVRLFK